MTQRPSGLSEGFFVRSSLDEATFFCYGRFRRKLPQEDKMRPNATFAIEINEAAEMLATEPTTARAR